MENNNPVKKRGQQENARKNRALGEAEGLRQPCATSLREPCATSKTIADARAECARFFEELKTWPVWQRYKKEMGGENAEARMMRAAQSWGRQLREAAKHRGIDLGGKKWVDPDALAPYSQRLCETFNQKSLSKSYIRWRDERTRQFVDTLGAGDVFRTICAEWHDYDDKTMLQKVEWLTRMQQLVFAKGTMQTCPVEVHEIYRAKIDDPDHPRVLSGHHGMPDPHSRLQMIGINMHPDARFRDFFNGINTVFHENIHVVQWGLADALASKRIGLLDPLYDDARLFLMGMFEIDSYISGVDTVYKAHPLEQDAYGASATFIALLKDGMDRHNIPAPAPLALHAA